ncbi:hypothetical protein WJX73_006698 [Symbiochloris irregularis]|uniref:Tetratricopeptide repeat protein 1 n=1 Tax=Symbiochloris irregularis TaxID=706552 RepID=A0AAW1PVC4_9CHLO
MRPTVVIEDVTDLEASQHSPEPAFATPPGSTNSDHEYESLASDSEEDASSLQHQSPEGARPHKNSRESLQQATRGLSSPGQQETLSVGQQQVKEEAISQAPGHSQGESNSDLEDEAISSSSPVQDVIPQLVAGTTSLGEPTTATEGQPVETLTPEEVEKRQKEAEALKQEGNKLYAAGELQEALTKYNEALDTAPESCSAQRAVYHSNISAVHLKQRAWAEAAQAASKALELDEKYIKALMRRATAYQELDDLEHALADYQKAADNHGPVEARREVARLTPIVNERREKMKDEMMGKLKDLGNTVLGKFGMSLDNFQTVKDPATGSYSINFKQ